MCSTGRCRAPLVPLFSGAGCLGGRRAALPWCAYRLRKAAKWRPQISADIRREAHYLHGYVRRDAHLRTWAHLPKYSPTASGPDQCQGYAGAREMPLAGVRPSIDLGGLLCGSVLPGRSAPCRGRLPAAATWHPPELQLGKIARADVTGCWLAPHATGRRYGSNPPCRGSGLQDFVRPSPPSHPVPTGPWRSPPAPMSS